MYVPNTDLESRDEDDVRKNEWSGVGMTGFREDETPKIWRGRRVLWKKFKNVPTQE